VEFQSEILRTYVDIICAHLTVFVYQHIIDFQHLNVISITVTPPSDFGVLENVQAITQQITPFKLKQ